MLNLNSIMIGSNKPKELAKFYAKVIETKPEWEDEEWCSWKAGDAHLTIGPHSEIKGKAKEPQRVIFNFQTDNVKEEFERIKKLGGNVIKEPYEMEGMWIATLKDPDGNYFQLMSSWEE